MSDHSCTGAIAARSARSLGSCRRLAPRPDPSRHPDIPTALAAHPDDPNIIWVTGPSKTADVEGILIEGVHGPGMQVALLTG